MADSKEKVGMALLSSTVVDMKTAQANTLYTVPTGKVCRLSHLVVRDPTASLAGGTSYSVTNWKLTFSLATVTGATYYIVIDNENTAYVETGAGVAIQLTVTTGSTLAANATVDLFGYLSS
jgi:hypothetical protein